MRLRGGLVLAVLASVLAGVPRAQIDSSSPPRLLVLLVVDQMRADYVDRFAGDWTGGLRRLLTEGAQFTNAAYPYLTTVTCPGHATLATGTFPHVHGVPQNEWYDRDRRQAVTCTEDDRVGALRYGGEDGQGESARRLRVPTLGDQLRRERDGRVVTLSLKARSAIMLAGQGGHAVTWMSDAGDGWVSSTAYAARPVPEVQTFASANPLRGDYGRVWARQLPLSRYLAPDDAPGERPPTGWMRTFPHVLEGTAGEPDASYLSRWQRSPFADAYVGRMAAALVESLQLGSRNTTDLLAVGFSSTDLVGHGFGPRSQEVQDMLARLDLTVGELLGRLDALVGPNRYVVALSSDHGVGDLPEQLADTGQDGGRVNRAELTTAIELAAQAAAGAGQYVARVQSNDIYFEPGMYDRLTRTPGAIAGVIKALEASAGIARVFQADRLAGDAGGADPVARAAALSLVPGRSGDLIVATQPGWLGPGSTSAAGHGTANTYDQRVPVVLWGPGIQRGRYDEAATPADVAPTLAWLAGVGLPNAEGRVLREALVGRAAAERPTR